MNVIATGGGAAAPSLRPPFAIHERVILWQRREHRVEGRYQPTEVTLALRERTRTEEHQAEVMRLFIEAPSRERSKPHVVRGDGSPLLDRDLEQHGVSRSVQFCPLADRDDVVAALPEALRNDDRDVLVEEKAQPPLSLDQLLTLAPEPVLSLRIVVQALDLGVDLVLELGVVREDLIDLGARQVQV